jgi:hypothetical protein
MSNLSIKVKTMIGKEYDFSVVSSDKVGILKTRLSEKVGINPDQQKLVFGGRPLVDDKAFSEQNVVAGSVIQLVLQLRG